ncbi:protein ITPRID2 isoform X2 [Sardina pilchardus]|uniref:protein ITPRID2 isoform X2 n=1 Tax=Sardina pilchardus TaxID=27697 RepID=UPI002E0FC05E
MQTDMEQCEPASEHEHPWKDATTKRRAWAKSRDSWQAPESQDDGGSEESPPVPAAEPMEEKPSAAKEPGRNNKIASWLEDCRTPLGASLDEQSGTPTKGVPRNGCSFEDDLSLGAEANHLQPNGTKAEVPCYGVPAREKRTQFKQKGRSMNSTGSGRSNTTVSSVSELLDLYEEDPEEILYNLGFGREEPNISSKVPSRFFSGTSGARGIDIKVYLSAQLQRMELENPNYALTSRFRQIEVLTTVANAFSSLYSQVSGLPVEKIGNVSSASPGVGGGASTDAEGDAKELPPVPRARAHSHSTLNAVKILKRTLTRHNLHAPAGSPEAGTATATATMAPAAAATNSDPGSPAIGGGGGGAAASNVSAEEHARLAEVKPQKAFRKKDSPSLATVAEEAGQGSSESNGDASDPAAAATATPVSESPDDQAQPQPAAQVEGPALGTETPVLVSISGVSEESDGDGSIGVNVKELGSDLQRAITSTPDKEPSSLLPNPLLDHLRTSPQARESFEMDELQEDEPGTRSTSRAGSELLRTASQQSDSSGFAEDPCADCSANYLKVQESSDSCDSETTVTSHAGDSANSLSTDAAAFETDAQAVLQTHGEEEEQEEEEEEEEEEGKKEVPEYTIHHFTRAADAIATQPVGSADEPGLTTTESTADASPQAEAGVSLELSSPMEAPAAHELGSPAEPGSTAERGITADLVSESAPGSAGESNGGSPEGSKPSASDLVRTALHRAQERSAMTGEDRTSRAPAPASADRAQELHKGRLGRMQRSSSLPASLLSPSRVVSSLRVQLGHGSVRHCATPTFSYRYTPDSDAAAAADAIREEGRNEDEEEEEEGEEGRRSCRTTLIIKSPTAATASDGPFSRTPLSAVPGHLTLSSSSLHGGALHDWPQQRALGEAGGWSSVPNLALGQQHAPSPTPHHHHHQQHHQHPPHQLPHFRSPYPGSAYNSLNSSFSGAFPYTPSPSPSPFFTPPHSAFFTPPHSASMLNSAPYGPLAHAASPFNFPYHPQQQQQQQPDSRYGSPLPPHAPSPAPSYSPLVHPHSAPYSLPYSTPPPGGLGQAYSAQYSGPPCFPFPHEPSPAGPPPVSTTEMQLRRVLHEIRGTVQSLARGSTPGPDDMPADAFSPQRSVQTLYEDLQMRKRSLCVFRTQMMDLELSLMRQQSQVYQHLSQEERMEAEQLQALRGSVRQELQELELQVEDRLLALNEQLRAAQHRGLYCHPMVSGCHYTFSMPQKYRAMHRGHSLDSMSNASALEPMSDLLREQLYLQSELGYEGGLSRATTPMSGRSSGTVSPVRSHRAASGRSSPQRGALYRATVCLTPAPPPRPGVEPPEQPPAGTEEEVVGGQGRTESCSPAVEQGSQPAINPHLLQERGREEAAAAGGGADNPHLQQLIKEIKESIANEIRQEIVSELLAAVAPRRAVAVSREQP